MSRTDTRRPGADSSPGHRGILTLAIPVMLSNVSTALIGVVDTAVVGRIPDAAYIGAVAVGSLIFTFVFWGFGFLRMGTTGLTAQSVGARDPEETSAILLRALVVAFGAGVVLILAQWPIREVAFALVEGSDTVEGLARSYFDIRILAAPFTLANYALLGWFIGLGRTGTGLALQLVLNLANIGLDALFVLGFGLDVRGVAAGTVLAECVAVALGLLLASRALPLWRCPLARVFVAARLRRLLRVSADIMVRTLALVFVFVWFTSKSAGQGDIALAANTVLMHFVSTSAYFLDGLAFAAESLVGRALGSGSRRNLQSAVRITTLWSVGVALATSGILFALGGPLIDLLTIDASARALAREFLPWAAAAPLLGSWAFQLDGIFIGATRTREMRNAMLAATGVFLVAWWLLTPFGNHGLWAAFWIHYIARIAGLAVFYSRLVVSVPA